MRTVILALISFYQKTVSPDHGIFSYFVGNEISYGVYSLRRCRFFPSCSEYSRAAFGQYGLLKGGVLSLTRIVRCGPWSRGGYDPVVKKLQILNSKL